MPAIPAIGRRASTRITFTSVPMRTTWPTWLLRVADVPVNDLGAENSAARLTQDQADTMRRRYSAGGLTYRELATEFAVSVSVVAAIITGRRYGTAKAPLPLLTCSVCGKRFHGRPGRVTCSPDCGRVRQREVGRVALRKWRARRRDTIRGLTIYQPWASLIAEGIKVYETRPWRAPYRGLVAIHAGKTGKYVTETPPEYRHLAYPLGAILAVANLETVVETERFSPSREEIMLGDWTRGRFAWRMAGVKKLKSPVPCRGFQGLWSVPPEVLRLVQTAGVVD